jgi:hypothetical protein
LKAGNTRLYVYTVKENARILVDHRQAQTFYKDQKSTSPRKKNKRSRMALPGRQRFSKKQQQHK